MCHNCTLFLSFTLYYSRALNQELKYRGIKVLAVCPFWTRTNFFDRAVVEGKKELVINIIESLNGEEILYEHCKNALQPFAEKINEGLEIYDTTGKDEIKGTDGNDIIHISSGDDVIVKGSLKVQIGKAVKLLAFLIFLLVSRDL